MNDELQISVMQAKLDQLWSSVGGMLPEIEKAVNVNATGGKIDGSLAKLCVAVVGMELCVRTLRELADSNDG